MLSSDMANNMHKVVIVDSTEKSFTRDNTENLVIVCNQKDRHMILLTKHVVVSAGRYGPTNSIWGAVAPGDNFFSIMSSG